MSRLEGGAEAEDIQRNRKDAIKNGKMRNCKNCGHAAKESSGMFVHTVGVSLGPIKSTCFLRRN